jgi:hypothetical protein
MHFNRVFRRGIGIRHAELANETIVEFMFADGLVIVVGDLDRAVLSAW